MADNISRKMTWDGKQQSMDDNLWWKSFWTGVWHLRPSLFFALFLQLLEEYLLFVKNVIHIWINVCEAYQKKIQMGMGSNGLMGGWDSGFLDGGETGLHWGGGGGGDRATLRGVTFPIPTPQLVTPRGSKWPILYKTNKITNACFDHRGSCTLIM